MDFIQRWKKEKVLVQHELEEYLDRCRINRPENIDKELAEKDREVFEEINCLECANCCKTSPALLKKKDIKRIAGQLGITPKKFIYLYVLEDINGDLSFKSVPCVFLEEDNKCSIYEFRPEACRDYPHTSSGSFIKRIKLHKANLDVCPATFEIVKRLQKN